MRSTGRQRRHWVDMRRKLTVALDLLLFGEGDGPVHPPGDCETQIGHRGGPRIRQPPQGQDTPRCHAAHEFWGVAPVQHPKMALPVFYRSTDPVEFLSVRILVRQVRDKVTAGAAAWARDPEAPPGTPHASMERLPPLAAGEGGEVYDRVFTWQEKIFSPK